MKRSFLTALGLEKEVVDSIIKEHGADVEVLKERHEEMLSAEKTKLQKKIDELQTKVDEHKDNVDDEWEQKYNDEVTAHKATKSAFEAEKDASVVDSLVAELLAQSDDDKILPETVIKKAIKQYDRSIVERDDKGKIKNADKIKEHFKAEWADFYMEVTENGTKPSNPPKPPKGQSDYISLLNEARKNNNHAEALRIKREAFENEKIVLT